MEERKEYLKKETEKYKEYYFKDTEKKIDQISHRVYMEEKKFVVYPLGFEGGQKYENIKSIEFINLKPIIPVGFYKSVNYGWGFTKPMGVFAVYLDKVLRIKTIKIVNTENHLDNKKKEIVLTEKFIKNFYKTLTVIKEQHKEEILNTILIELNSIFPDKIKRPVKEYKKDQLSTVLKTWGNDINEFSDNDKNEILNLFNKLSLTSFIDTINLNNTKKIIESKLIKDTINNFKKLLKSTSETKTLEKKWQSFLQNNSWIFSSIFAQPIILFGREIYVGGKTLDNTNGKYTDFLLTNKLSNNICFFEIKTHLTKLVEDKPYRGKDVFGMSKELNGCISQVLNQKDTFQKDYYSSKVKSNRNFESLNSPTIVLIGRLSSLSKEQLKSFELFRTNIPNVTILTFDEVLEKLKVFSSLIG